MRGCSIRTAETETDQAETFDRTAASGPAGPATSEPWPPTPAGTPCTSARTRLAQRRGLLTGPV